MPPKEFSNSTNNLHICLVLISNILKKIEKVTTNSTISLKLYKIIFNSRHFVRKPTKCRESFSTLVLFHHWNWNSKFLGIITCTFITGIGVAQYSHQRIISQYSAQSTG